jgi:hypothetical protein
MGLKHLKENTIADQADATPVRPSDWNQDHYLLDDDYVAVGALGDLVYRGVDGLITHLPAVAGVLVSPGSGQVPAYTMTPSLTSLTLTTALTPANGGTGLASYAVGDLVYASGATTLSKLADVATGSVLVSGGVGVAPAWSASPTLTRVFVGDGTAALPALALASAPTYGFYSQNGNLAISVAGVGKFEFLAAQFQLVSDASVAWSSGTINQASDLFLSREAANHMFQRNTTSAQRLSVANTYASTISYEAFSVDWQTTANVARVGTRTAATGTGRELQLVSQLSSAADFYAAQRIHANVFPFIRQGTYNAAGSVGSTGSLAGNFSVLGEFSSAATSGTIVAVAVIPTYNQSSGSAANTDFLINRTQTAVGSGTQRLIDAQVGGTSMFSISNTGVLTTAATTFMHSTSASLANGAAAQTGTLTNAPSAGNPTKWIAINDNGTTRYIPAW